MSDMAISFSVLGALVVLFVWNRFPVEIVAIGFGDASVVFIATLFVISEGLDATGVTTWAGQQMITRVGDDRGRRGRRTRSVRLLRVRLGRGAAARRHGRDPWCSSGIGCCRRDAPDDPRRPERAPATLLQQYTVHDPALDATANNPLVNRDDGVAEVLIPPRSRAIGTTVSPG